VHVQHQGDPPELFQAQVPVVLEGHWSADGSFFASDRILVKHTEEYKASNPDHVNSTSP
jgi:cytochrome c-type biogenesis protein CcmE